MEPSVWSEALQTGSIKYLVVFRCESQSTIKTFRPLPARPYAVVTAEVVLLEPPLLLYMAMKLT